MKRSFTFLPVVVLLALPLVVFAQSAPFQYSQQGIMSCSGGGAAQSIGSQSATVGIYVPVADATVELNTGILVYKECVLRQIVIKMRESATSAFTGQMVNSINTGRDGNPQFLVNESKEVLLVRDKGKLVGIQIGQGALNPALSNVDTSAVARNYLASTQKSKGILACPFKGNLDAYSHNQPNSFSFEGLAASGDPSCNALGLFYRYSEQSDAVAAQAVQYQENDWARGRGFYSKTDKTYDPLGASIKTPASVVQESFQQVFGSGFRQLESADDVGQIVGALFAGITNQVTSNSQGLYGLNQSFNGQPSYLDQVTSQSKTGLIGSVVNATLQILNAARAVEVAFLQVLNSIIGTLSQTTAQLKDTENQCWKLLVPLVEAYASSTAMTIKVATSTQFSQEIVGAQVAPLQATTMERATTSRLMILRIDGLVMALTNPPSDAARQAAIQTVDTLVAQGAFHTSQDLGVVRGQQQAVTDAMAILVQNTIDTWSKSEDPNVGWCNANNPAVIKMWAEKWKK